jgi:hypothetical protein
MLIRQGQEPGAGGSLVKPTRDRLILATADESDPLERAADIPSEAPPDRTSWGRNPAGRPTDLGSRLPARVDHSRAEGQGHTAGASTSRRRPVAIMSHHSLADGNSCSSPGL